MKRTWRPLDGVLLFDKPLEISSNTGLQKVRRLFQAEKAGHTGTLDPLATGLLPVCFGEATKFSAGLLDADKTYRAVAKLGVTTTTGDVEGEVVAVRPVAIDGTQLDAVFRQFLGPISQLPPMYSALKYQGKPLYEYIRQGETVERQPRQVVIHELTLESWQDEVLVFSVRCSKGTYVRTLAEDIGEALGCGAHLTALRRTAIAHLRLDQAYTLEQLEAFSPEARDECLLPVDTLLPEYPKLMLDEVQIRLIGQGRQLRLDQNLPEGKVRLYCGQTGFVGVGKLTDGVLAPERLSAKIARAAAQVSVS